jgi:Bacterial DNA-binding protein
VKVAEKCRSQAVSMTKADLIAVIADKLRFPLARAELLVEVVLGSTEQSMSRGEKVEIRATHPLYPGRSPWSDLRVHDGPKFARPRCTQEPCPETPIL